ncbi:hypothetical protein OEZ60_21020 [Defluviimonas sp. WL0024]|uniref:Uncharacterized protein n=2 Tax=Albidovulum TaxID=205889 RepID=A0ABT3J9W8_9RHOB|nr:MULTISPECIES: hypothetical protein [Defluviimonas]MCU9850470.1 hypothetical protein [Defluviimonas sp. WL0024]MCW3784470.1 hypothetical protein [Defluviimonas salinarum]
MKLFAMTAAAIAAFAPAAFAMTEASVLTDLDRAEVRQIVPGADLSNLTAAQEAALATVIYGGDSHGEKGGHIRAILN